MKYKIGEELFNSKIQIQIRFSTLLNSYKVGSILNKEDSDFILELIKYSVNYHNIINGLEYFIIERSTYRSKAKKINAIKSYGLFTLHIKECIENIGKEIIYNKPYKRQILNEENFFIFGKYAGSLLNDILVEDQNYLEWLITKDFDEDSIIKVRKILNIVD
jgi:uncharacterized protein (DUF3820 family)